MPHYAIDLGTTNTVVSRWNDEDKTPDLIELPGISRGMREGQVIENQYAIPSVLFLGDLKRFLFFKKQEVQIGEQALDKHSHSANHRYVDNFKPYLMADGFKTMTNVEGSVYSARKIAELFLGEIFRAVKSRHGKRPASVTFSVPVDCYEPYRAQLRHMAKALGLRDFRLVDEPVAAAIGYGLCVDHPQNVLVFDFGGGTLDIAIVRFEEKITPSGRCRVIAKEGLPLGGNTVDAWLVEFFSRELSYELPDIEKDRDNFWFRIMLKEACRIKGGLVFQGTRDFLPLAARGVAEFRSKNLCEEQYARPTSRHKPRGVYRLA